MRHRFAVVLIVTLLLPVSLLAADPNTRIPLSLNADDVIPTGNEWISLPTINAKDASLSNFNVISMRDRGLLEVTGQNGAPVLQPYFTIDGKPLAFRSPSWELIEYWIPVAHLAAEGVEVSVTYCAPPGSRGAFIRLTLTNRRNAPIAAAAGMKASWGGLNRVTYTPVAQRGERSMSDAPWVPNGQVFSFTTHDTLFAWSLLYPEARVQALAPPLASAPQVDAARASSLQPGQTMEAIFVLGAGAEEFSAAHNAKALREVIDRYGADDIINQAAKWCRERRRTTGQADLDTLMNRNLLFTAFYAWGRSIDTEQLVGVTSRSPLYYVSAAYWDRDAMLWSFPGLLDIDPALARDSLEYALTTQLRNTGIHSRFIDGVVLEDGFQLDEGVAPIIALGQYHAHTHDDAFLIAHRQAIDSLRDRLLGRFDAKLGLYSTLQDSQDEYQKLPYMTYDNVLSWHALQDLSALYRALKDEETARAMADRANSLKQNILKHCVASDAPGAGGPIFATATDGKNAVFTEIPPGSLLRLPTLGFISEDDPLFARTYNWFHSKNYQYSYSDQPYGLPGSYRLPFTASWAVADHLLLARGRQQALKILRTSKWDGGIITEGVSSGSGVMDLQGRAFATAAGYVAHAICQMYCKDAPPGRPSAK